MFEQMQGGVAGPAGTLRPIESVIEDWTDLVTDYVLLKVWEHERETAAHDPNIALLTQYLNGPEARQKAEAYTLIWGTSIREILRSTFSTRPPERHLTQNDALTAVVAYLHAHKTRAVAIFDSMDEYQTGEPRSDRTVGALLRFAAPLTSTHS